MENIIIKFSRRLFFGLSCIQNPIKKKILFMSFNGKQYSDNPRAISEKMHELYPKYEIVWYLTNTIDEYGIIPSYVRVVSGRWLNFLKELASSCCLVTNIQIEDGIFKRKGQLFVQTWHGDRTFKKVLYDSWEKGERPLAVLDDQMTDFCIAASDYGSKVYRTAFKYNGEIFKIGSPRNDRLFSFSIKEQEQLKQKMGIPIETKVLLYAPTFRDNNEGKQELNVNLSKVLDILCHNGDEWICCVRTHPKVKGFRTDVSNFIDMSKYPDMTDLLIVSDMLITDYSSCAGDFILKKKPVILTVFDYKEYESESRAFNVSLEDTGYILAYNQLELEKILLKSREEDYIESSKRVMEFYGTIESGKASEKVCDKINEFYTMNF